MAAYYNEFDPFMAQWLRNLIQAGLIAKGVVDDRSITDVRASDLCGFTQCHFFAGLGGWSYALRLAGVPDTFPCWTGSPPCQPFSVVGAGLGKDDSRHLAPTFLDLVSECRPSMLFGEQVANAVKKDFWVDALLIELGEEGYACGFDVLPACGAGASHKRERIFFGASRVANTNSERCHGVYPLLREGQDHLFKTTGGGEASHVANTHSEFKQGQRAGSHEERRKESDIRPAGLCSGTGSECTTTNQNFWSTANWVECSDGKFRAIEPGSFPLVNGIPKGLGRGKSSPSTLANLNRKGRLKGYGNAIVPQVAAEFIKAFTECAPSFN